MNADELVGYGLITLGVVVAALILLVVLILWVVQCLRHPWVEPAKRDRGWHRW